MKRQRIAIQVLLILIGICFLTFGVLECLPKEKCYSYEYSIYLELKETTNIDDVRAKLQTLKLEYTLQDNKLTLNRYKNIVFDVLDDKMCSIASNNAMQNFERMDSGSIIDMTFDGLLQYDGIHETITLKDDEFTYIKRGDNYFIISPVNVSLPALYFIIATTSLFIAYAFGYSVKRRRKVTLKESTKPSDSTKKTT